MEIITCQVIIAGYNNGEYSEIIDKMARDWDFDAGRLPLDFANTAEWHASDQPQEMLETYPDLVAWGEEAQLLSKSEAASLLEHSRRQPEDAKKALRQAVAVRDAVFRIFSAFASGEPPHDSDLSKFNQALSSGLEKARITLTSTGFEWTREKSDDALDQMLWPVLHATAELLTSQDINRVGECADDRGCGYLFYDTSRNHSRRWCSMEDCGNRAKAKRHYQRKK
jgi:predicted RNA-binding Zn ribbon-like protein